jgi:hypothetical protein
MSRLSDVVARVVGGRNMALEPNRPLGIRENVVVKVVRDADDSRTVDAPDPQSAQVDPAA